MNRRLAPPPAGWAPPASARPSNRATAVAALASAASFAGLLALAFAPCGAWAVETLTRAGAL